MTRRDRRRRFSEFLRNLFVQPSSAQSRRRVLVEPLENRQLLAGDAFDALLGSSYDEAPSLPTTHGLVGEGELVAEGEDSADLVAFAQALTDSGTLFYGAAWCPFCTAQKELFEDGGKFLPFVEVSNPDRSPNQIAIDEGITQYPTWEFPDGSRLTGLQSLETLAARAEITIPQSSTPSFDELNNVSVEVGSPLHIPIDAYDPNGNPLTITVTSSDPSLITADVLSGNRSLRLSVGGFGDMVFELFEDRAPVPAGRVIQLAEDGFYDGVIFHRVINNFVIQGGDPTGTGSGGSTLGDFDDQFNVELQHNRTGVLSFAKSSDDTNDSQFFITEGPQRFLDFNHSVFGQLVEGESNREGISNTATSGSDRPINDVVIDSATVFDDTENGVVRLKATGNGSGSATITVTVSDTEGNSTSQSFQATVTADAANGAPFLNPISSVQTTVNTPVTVNLTSQDAEGDTVVYSVQPLGSTSFGLSVDSSTGVATVTPPTGFTGQLQFRATVRQTTTPTTSSPDDNQTITVQVIQSVPTSVDLNAASDSGSSNSDNVTNADSLTFTVSGTTSGALVEVLAGGSVVGSATASGSTTEVVVGDLSGLGQGSVLFASRQTTNGQTSGNSPGLAVVLDRTAPNGIGSGVIPTSIAVGDQLAVDIDHSEENQGLIYSLSSAPTGMTIGSDGQLSWTPTSEQLGQQAIALTLTDAAGNSTEQQISINVTPQPDLRILLNPVDANGQPITTVAAGETFKVQVTVEDLRPGVSGTGVFASFVDLIYNSEIIEPVAVNPISYVSPYTNGRSGSTATLGVVDELGAFTADTNRLGNDLRVLAEVTFLAKAAGNAGLMLESADENGNDNLLFDETEAVDLSRVEFGSSSFAVGANFEPIDDAFNFDEDTGGHSLNVLANDVLTGGAELTIVGVSTPQSGGLVTIATDGKTLNYTSAANFNGAESFTYTAENQEGVRLSATVTVQVTDINDPPIALNDTFTVFENSTNNVLEVLANDNSGVDDSTSESLRVTSVSSGSAGGAITLGPSGLRITYSPRTGFRGTESFTYTLSDGRGGTSTGAVTVSVSQENPPPTPQNDSFTLDEDSPAQTFDLLLNDTTDDPQETLSISGVGQSLQGSQFTVGADGLTVSYQPAANFNGTEILTYTLRDSGGAEATGLVTFTVNAVNDPPTAVDDSTTAIASEASTTITVLDNDSTVDAGETLTITNVTQPPSGRGSIAISQDGTRLVYTSPGGDFEGMFSVTYTIDDGTGLTDTATVEIDVRDFILRDFTGTVVGPGGSRILPYGFPLELAGTDLTGNQVFDSFVVGADGVFNFAQKAPGNYTLIRPALPFIEDAGETLAINSAVTDGDMVQNLVLPGTLRPQFIDIRDFLGSATHSLAVAVDAAGAQSWVAARGAWSELSSLSALLDPSTNTLSVSAVDQNATSLAADLDITDSTSRVYQAGMDSPFRLLRLRGTPDSAGLRAGPSSTAQGEGENSRVQPLTSAGTGATLTAEGEGQPEITTPPTPTLSAVRVTPSASGGVLSPSQAIRRLLGSAQRNNAGVDDSGLSESAVDAAMSDVLPSLELQLSNSLQSTLVSDSGESFAATDALFGQL